MTRNLQEDDEMMQAHHTVQFLRVCHLIQCFLQISLLEFFFNMDRKSLFCFFTLGEERFFDWIFVFCLTLFMRLTNETYKCFNAPILFYNVSPSSPFTRTNTVLLEFFHFCNAFSLVLDIYINHCFILRQSKAKIKHRSFIL